MDELRGAEKLDSNGAFTQLLATKFGCRIPGFCEAGSTFLFGICQRGMISFSGDNLDMIAQRNLSPVDYAYWQRAHLKNSPR